MDIISRSLVRAWFPGSRNGVLPDYIHFRGLSGPSLGRGSLCPADYPYFKSPGERGRPLKSSRVQVRAEYVYPPSSLPTARLDECPWTRQFRSPSFVFFFSFSSLPIGSLLGRSCFASPLHLQADIDSIIYITEIVLHNEISKSFVLL